MQIITFKISLFLTLRLVGKVFHQDLFPDSVMKARRDEKKKVKSMHSKESSASGLFETESSNHQVTSS